MNADRRRKLESARVVVSRGMAANGVAVGCSRATAWVSIPRCAIAHATAGCGAGYSLRETVVRAKLANWADISDVARGPRFAVNLRGAEHLTPSDAVWLAEGAIKTGSMGPDKTIEALRNYTAAFLDANLRETSLEPLLVGPSADYPDAEVTTQKESLCSEAIDH